MMSASTGNFIVRLQAALMTDREILRRKAQQLVKRFNGGSTEISFYGFNVDLFVLLEKKLNTLSEYEVQEILRILRE